MEAATTSSALVPYTGQPFTQSTSGFAPAGDPGSGSATAATIRAELLAGGVSVDFEVGRLVDELWEGEPYEMPNCAGLSGADCQVAIVAAATAVAGDAPSFSLTTATGSEQDLSMLAGGVLAQLPTPGTPGRVAVVGLTVNPDPMNGFSGSGGYSGGGVTTPGPGRCEFDDHAGLDWDTVAAEDPDFYEQACADAWALFESAGYLTPEGQLTTPALNSTRILIRGRYFNKQETIDHLTADGTNILDWSKLATPQTPLTTPYGPAELHFYRHSSGVVNLGKDFKIVFKVAF